MGEDLQETAKIEHALPLTHIVPGSVRLIIRRASVVVDNDPVQDLSESNLSIFWEFFACQLPVCPRCRPAPGTEPRVIFRCKLPLIARATDRWIFGLEIMLVREPTSLVE